MSISSAPSTAAPRVSSFAKDLDKCTANFAPMCVVDFLRRSAEVYPYRPAIVDPAYESDVGFPSQPSSLTYSALYARCRRLASALSLVGVGRLDCVATLTFNMPAMLEACFGVLMAGAVLNPINFRLQSHEVAFILRHSEAKVVLCHTEFAGVLKHALEENAKHNTPAPRVIYIHEIGDAEKTKNLGDHISYEEFIHGHNVNPMFEWLRPLDEWDSACLNYTSGTTGDPKGVVTHHRGLYLQALNVCTEWGLSPSAMPRSVAPSGHMVYLWTLPMFHCTGWNFPYTVAAVAGTNVILRKVRAKAIYDAIEDFSVTHLCGAPTVLDSLAFAPPSEIKPPSHTVSIFTGGAPPPERVFTALKKLNFNVTQIYGLTEVYGPVTICEYQEQWATLSDQEEAHLKALPGVKMVVTGDMIVGNLHPSDPNRVVEVKHDGQQLGEILYRGNLTMKGYLKNPSSTKKAFQAGYFWTGDIAVVHPSGYVQIKDRSKDVIISGGENISSIEVQSIILKHPAVLNAAVVAMPHAKWGETPIAFVELKPDAKLTESELIAFCRTELASYKCPTRVEFGALPMTSTGKIQKFKLREMAMEVAARTQGRIEGPFTASGAVHVSHSPSHFSPSPSPSPSPPMFRSSL